MASLLPFAWLFRYGDLRQVLDRRAPHALAEAYCEYPTAMYRLITFGCLILSTTAISALDIDETRHLLDRVGFGASAADIEPYAPLSRSEAVERLLGVPQEAQALPEWARERPLPAPRRFDQVPEAQRLALRRAEIRIQRRQQTALKAWWYRQMLATEAPLHEHLLLFWHNHFTTELRRVRSPQLMLRQHLLLRQHALGNYAELLRAVTTDPAMLVYLDGRRNHRKQPNENFSRELLELFTLGEGHFGEADVRGAARALSGWVVEPASGTARFDPRRFDDGKKTFLGRSGHWGLDGVIAMVLAQPRTAELLVEKLWVALVSPQPEPAEVTRLAALFREGGYEIRPLLRALLLSDAFWGEECRGTLIKSPVELIVGTLRRFDLPGPPDGQLIGIGRQMGQDLFDPPDVKGWPGYTAWIDTDRLLARDRFLRRVTRDLADESAQAGQPWASLDATTAAGLLWPSSVEVALAPAEEGQASHSAEANVRNELINLILDPRYQLK